MECAAAQTRNIRQKRRVSAVADCNRGNRNPHIPRLREQGFAAARFADQEHAAGDATAEALELFGVLEEFDDFTDFLLGFFDAGDIIEGDVGLLFVGELVLGAAEVVEEAPAAKPKRSRKTKEEAA